MAHYQPDESLHANLKGKVVVLSGGATGIGAATVRLLAQHEAHVVFGDVNDPVAEELVTQTPGVKYIHCDVVKYNDIYDLFKTAYDQYGRVDHAFSCAGIFEQGNWYDPKLTIESIKDDPGNTKTIHVNVLGTLQFSRIATIFLREGMKEGEDKSLTLTSSVNAFRESPGLFLYQTSKHAVHGLLRSSRKTLFERDHIRVNAICPGVTDTPMAAKVIEPFKENGLFWQSPESVAKIVVGLEASSHIHGKAFYIEGGDGYEFEDSFYNTQPHWLGEEPTRRMRANAEAVQKGALVPKE
ncbi:3-hydroxyacyl- dehydrogenase [Lecanosticta acicola]|uniref:3-hydroxyacyl- dehydrogenase n=1 Tax=Lecanosticta acicola TaxID=111012 RepID=A0AAI8Z1C1_9PEZI|nr:3-hydroxyacyl- dehydrogenase [Lecanosticta acicola]